eukprot:3896519-Rhodomonas_salina.1
MSRRCLAAVFLFGSRFLSCPVLSFRFFLSVWRYLVLRVGCSSRVLYFQAHRRAHRAMVGYSTRSDACYSALAFTHARENTQHPHWYPEKEVAWSGFRGVDGALD